MSMMTVYTPLDVSYEIVKKSMEGQLTVTTTFDPSSIDSSNPIYHLQQAYKKITPDGHLVLIEPHDDIIFTSYYMPSPEHLAALKQLVAVYERKAKILKINSNSAD